MTSHLIRSIALTALTLFLALPAQAQQQPLPLEDEALDEPVVGEKLAEQPDLYGPGTVDAQLTLSFGTFLTPQLEPAIDIGLIPFGDTLTLSLGASAAVGYCVGCLLFTALTPIDVRNWMFTPQLRVLLHIEDLAYALGLLELDLYAGLVAGPSFHAFTLTERATGDSATERVLGVGGGPLLGLHYLISDRIFVGTELKYVLTRSVNTQTLDVGGTTYSESEFSTYLQNGLDYNVHLGARF